MAWTDPRTWVTSETVTSTTMNSAVRDNMNAVLPLGAPVLIPVAATTVETTRESRWIEANGVAVSRSTYATLFALVSTAFGVGDGSTTFNLPDLRGRMAVGHGSPSGHADVQTLGGTEGSALASRRPKHQHSSGDAGFNPSGSGATFSWNVATPSTAVGPAYLVYGAWYVKYTA